MPRHVAIPLLLLLALAAPVLAAAAPTYDVDYRVRLVPEDGTAEVAIVVGQDDGVLRELGLELDPDLYDDVRGDGEVEREGDRVTWLPPKAGGTLRYSHRIDHRRRGGGYDARITRDWALLRGDDLVPPARVRVAKGARSKATLHVAGPEGWTAQTQWPELEKGSFAVTNPEHSLARPTGWLIAGDIGIRLERVAGTLLVVAAPKGDSMRRNEILAMLNLVLPEMKAAFGRLPPKLLIVGADDPMWRGGLSAPQSLYMHSDRPLISENGTSTLVHEVVHVVTGVRGAGRDRWIGEGIAEYYSLRLLRQVGMLSDSRYERAMGWMDERGGEADSLRARLAQGAIRARAVVLFRDLDDEIRQESDGGKSLDDLVRVLMKDGSVDLEDLREAAQQVLGRPAKSLDVPLLDA
ncbi:hypothetical protein [Coralloluteibacterium stylophorae]|uniref:Peptidase M61 catalytic domain-containing protein n=1 Tax=Coralloluteibacterium stylophorae TaxID=1776034 RepID=A0A8J7VXK3_9GAMM|nr:hypothetical protein [Coralloluteibacterium stylophorae]MBS7458362.1 hypothetical protein [Coralloluteibacterium stylophorae]